MEKKPFLAKKLQSFKVPKIVFFQKGLTHAFHQRMYFFLYLFLVTIRPEIMFNNVIDGKKPFLAIKNSIFESPKYRIFPKGLTHAFGQKM